MATFTFREAYWSRDFAREWLHLLSELWALGVRWEWHGEDFYIDPKDPYYVLRKTGSFYNCKEPIPLPSWSVIQDMAEWIHDKDRDLYRRVYDFSQNLVPKNEVN